MPAGGSARPPFAIDVAVANRHWVVIAFAAARRRSLSMLLAPPDAHSEGAAATSATSACAALNGAPSKPRAAALASRSRRCGLRTALGQRRPQHTLRRRELLLCRGHPRLLRRTLLGLLLLCRAPCCATTTTATNAATSASPAGPATPIASAKVGARARGETAGRGRRDRRTAHAVAAHRGTVVVCVQEFSIRLRRARCGCGLHSVACGRVGPPSQAAVAALWGLQTASALRVGEDIVPSWSQEVIGDTP